MTGKKIRNLLLSCLFVLCGMLYFNTTAAQAQDLTEAITPTKVNNIREDATKLLVAYPAVDDQNYTYVFEFKVNQTSEVRITGLSRYAFYNWGGTTKYTLTDSLDEFSTSYNETWETHVFADHAWSEKAGNYCDKFFTLKKGTYYLTVTTKLSDDFRTREWNNQTIYDYDLGYWMSVNVSPFTKQVKWQWCKNTAGKKISLKFNKVSASGYEIQYSTNKKFKNKQTVRTITNNTTIKNLKKGKTYYVRVRAYRYDSEGKKVYGQWSQLKKVKIKK